MVTESKGGRERVQKEEETYFFLARKGIFSISLYSELIKVSQNEFSFLVVKFSVMRQGE